ncbi:GNAT family N-acetyltransferase [Enterococcus wangshanyuanii]|uniref:N-acetyltransferase domain-containing protein n=1 Tax=Enterococcus wangshanyuanii TaxID=2005703 RepID=A0ABQ1NL98_9ENTE|nr:GNAT family N-acetyltransferase [Enterococcus wangshanyuanii]GGC79498.1 hypothetical protein GCM10011573_06460 [Enterococcus wangshanyuanii]
MSTNLEIHTKRCMIRRFKESDIDSFMEYRNDMDWMRHQGLKGLTKQKYADILLGEKSLKSGVQLAIVSKKNGDLIGDIYLKQEKDSCWIGYSVRQSEARQGYAYESVNATINYLKENGIKSIEAEVENSNYSSIKFLNKLKFNCVHSDQDRKIFVLHL